MKITVGIIICAEFDVLFGFEPATRSIYRYYTLVILQAFGDMWPYLDLILYLIDSDIVSNTYVKFHSVSNPINICFTCQQVLFWLPPASISIYIRCRSHTVFIQNKLGKREKSMENLSEFFRLTLLFPH